MNEEDKKSILIVDDDKANIITLMHILTPEYTVYAVKKGQDAIEAANKHLPDVILLDIIMPEMDGYETLAVLKSRKETRDIPVIFITGLVGAEEEEKGLGLGAADYIPKPLKPAVVKLRIQNQIQIMNQINMIKQSSIVENSPQFILYLTIDGAVSYANPATENMTGHSLSEIMAGGLELIFDRQTTKEIREKHIPSAIQNKLHKFEISINRKDGAIKILLITSFVTDKGDIGVIAQDITEMRTLEDALRSKTEEVKSALLEAQAANRSKSEFLSRMSHELRTPMNAIMGIMQILKISKAPDKMEKYLAEIEKASGQLLGLIDDVLDISDMEYGVFKLTNSSFELEELFNEVLDAAKYNTGVKQLILETIIDPALPDRLTGDKKRIKQIIGTLLSNAVKFTPEGGKILFSAALQNEDDNFAVLKIEVSDNGIGMSKELQSGVFDMFEQADGGLTRKHGGIGLGLALSKRIIELMGGSVFFDSEQGKGTKVSFTCKLQKI